MTPDDLDTRWRFTCHALLRMQQRGIQVCEVLVAVTNPDTTVPARGGGGLRVYHAGMTDGRILRVWADGERRRIVTAAWWGDD